MRLPQVIVAHPGKQHSPQTVLALQEGGMLAGYYTSIWYHPNHWPYSFMQRVFPRVWSRLEPELVKRYYFAPLHQEVVRQFPWPQALRLLVKGALQSGCWDDYFNYVIGRSFDLWCSKRLTPGIKGDVVVGYEMSSLRLFQRARELGLITILDLAAMGWPLQKRMMALEGISANDRFLDKCNRLKQRELELADVIVVGSTLALSSLEETGINIDKVLVIPYGFNKELFPLKTNYPKRNKLILLFVGALNLTKGIKYLLEAVQQLANPEIVLLMIGGMGDAEPLLKQYHGLYQHVPFTSQHQLARYYQDADVLLMPSLVDSFGMVTIEAMASGMPVIVSEHTGSKDAVEDGLNGFVVPIRDVDALKNKILFFYQNRAQLEIFGRAAYKTAQQYTWEIYRQRVRTAIIDIFNGKLGISGIKFPGTKF